VLPATPTTALALDETSAYVSMITGQLVAIRLADGKPRWTIDAKPTTAVAAGNGLVFVGADGQIEAHAVADGAVRWRTPIGGATTAPLVSDGGWLIVATDQHELLAVRGSDGVVVWRARLDAEVHARSALAGERLYVPTTDGHVIALGLTTGERAWDTKLGDAAADILALEDRLYVGSRDNWFYCLETATGKRRWRMRTGADVIGAPVVDTSRVYVVSMDNVLRALDRSRGNLEWLAPLPLRPSGGPLLVDDLLLVAGRTVSLRGFLRKDGQPAGEYGAPADLAAPPAYIERVAGLRAAPLVVMLVFDETGTAHLEAMTSELPTI
jgi:outer membrane protein assembly factor BamB